MYRSSYSEVMEDDPQLARANERAVILHSIQLLDRAEEAGPKSQQAVEALLFLRRLWEFLLIELGNSREPAAGEASCGAHFSGDRTAERGGRYKPRRVSDFASLKQISQTIADGLQ